MCCSCGGGDAIILKLQKDIVNEDETDLLPEWLTSLNETDDRYVWDRLGDMQVKQGNMDNLQPILVTEEYELIWNSELNKTFDGYTRPLKDFEYATFYLRQDESTKTYKRTTYDFLDWFGDLGGIQ